jgi:hypothetical protein
MRTVAVVVVVLIIVAAAVSFRRSTKQISEQDDPAMAVMRAEMSWGAVDKPNRCQSESSGQAGVTRPQRATIAGWNYRFNDINGRLLLRLVGREELDGISVLFYEMPLDDPAANNRSWKVRYWIGTNDVLPHKSEVVQYSDGSEVARETTTCRYELVTIKPPM